MRGGKGESRNTAPGRPGWTPVRRRPSSNEGTKGTAFSGEGTEKGEGTDEHADGEEKRVKEEWEGEGGKMVYGP